MLPKYLTRAVAWCSMFVILLSVGAQAAVSSGYVELADPSTGAISEITVGFRLGTAGSLSAQYGAADSIYLVFDNSFTLPASIASQHVLVNGVKAAAVSVNRGSGIVTVDVPEDLQGQETVTVIFKAAAGIKNPAQAGSYDIGVYTSNETDLVWLRTQIVGPALGSPEILPQPATAGAAASYEIAFTAGSALVSGSDTITLTFPSGTTVPKSIDRRYIKVNNNQLSSAPTISSRTLTFTMPVSISSGRNIAVTIDSSAGLMNPIAAGDYSLTVKTSKDNAVSGRYRIISGISRPAVSVDPAVAGRSARYSVSFSTGPSGSLQGGSDQITVQFPAGTVLPTSISPAHIKVNGSTVNIGTVKKEGRALTFYLPSQVNVAASRQVTVVFEAAAGIQNPARGSYTLAVSTSADPTSVNSGSYSITAGSISQPEVVVEPAAAWADAKYTISFTTSSQGAMTGGKDTITVDFPRNTEVPSRISTSRIKVNGTAVNIGSVTRSGSSITFTMPSKVNVAASRRLEVVIDQAAGITNPGPGSYSLDVSTSADPSPVTSKKYSIAGTVGQPAVEVTPPVTAGSAAYEISFKTSSSGALSGDKDTLYIAFPTGTTVARNINRADIAVNGQTLTSTPTVSSRTITMKLPSRVSVGANKTITVLIKDGVITNPAVAGDYRLQVTTSQDTAWQSSEAYTIYGSKVEKATVSLSSDRQQEASAYDIAFRLSSGGALAGDKDTISVTFPRGTVLPKTISPNIVSLNGVSMAGGTVSVDGLTVTVGLPKGLSVRSSALITLNFPSAAGIQNPAAGSYSLTVKTSKDPIASGSNLYVIRSQQIIRIRIDDKTALVDGRAVTMDVPPRLISSRTMVPLRFIGDALGARTDYNANTRGITITMGGRVVRLTVDSKTATIDSQPTTLDAPATVINGRTLVPTRFISEAFGARVDWLQETRTVLIVK